MASYYYLVLAHGIVMSLAILWFIPIAIFASAFFRSRGDSLSHSKSTWKVIHIISNVIATGLIIAGFTLGYYASGNSFQVGTKNAHFIIGLTFFIGILLQSISGVVMLIVNRLYSFSRRPIQNWIHMTFGYLIALLGVSNIWLGLRYYGSPHYLYGLWIAAVAVWLALYIAGIPLRRTAVKKYNAPKNQKEELNRLDDDSA